MESGPGRVKQSYTVGARSLASRSVTGLARTRVTPNMLTAAGVTLCLAAAVIVPFESRNHLLYYWLGAAVFVVGSVLDILDGALARAGGKSTPFGAFLDSTTDRVGEGAMLAAIGLVFARAGNDTAVVFTVIAVGGSFLVPYVRAKAESLGVSATVGPAPREARVVILLLGLAAWALFGENELYLVAVLVVAALALITFVQRVVVTARALRQTKEGI